MQHGIDQTAKVFSNVEIGKGTSVGEFSIIGKPYRPVHGLPYESKNWTKIGKNCYIGSFVIVGQGTEINENTIVEDYSKLESDVKIGSGCILLYGSQICNGSKIGNDSIIGDFVCERAIIGCDSRIFGKLVHKQLDPSSGWDDEIEAPPIINRNVFVGFGAKIIGGVEVGYNSYICSGAIVTKDVPEFCVAYGTNQFIHYKNWKGPLSKSPFFKADRKWKTD
jgi:acetyltransferase-like isoleucine patch superfamily enzyme